MAMTPLKKPFTGAEKRAIDAAYDAIVDVVGRSTPRLAALLVVGLKTSIKDFENNTIGKIHVIESFGKGYRNEVKVLDMHRMNDGDIDAAIVGAGFMSERPDDDMTALFRLSDAALAARTSWRTRL